MSFNSFYFVFFLISVLLLYYIMPKKHRWIVLLCAGYGFYYVSGIKNFIFILATTITTYITGKMLHKTREQLPDSDKETKARVKKKNRIILAISIIFNFSILLFLKYFNFFGDTVNFITGRDSVPYLNLLLPLGISFYTFQSVGYMIDVYRGKTEACTNIFKYALFISYFPQIIQGPINKYDELKEELFYSEGFDWDNLKYGIQLMLWGYFKKMIIADRLSVLVDHVFANYGEYGGFVIFFSVFMYSIQLYCDFSGGIDIALGASKTFGINMTENFKRPFFAVSVEDFWRRWHISLSRWMKDYLFYPLSLSRGFTKMGRLTRKLFGNNVGKLMPACIATVIVFLAVGMWQGPDWKFIAYGLWNGLLISLGMLFKRFFISASARLHLKPDNFGMRILGMLRTIFLITIGRYFSRADSTMQAFSMLKRTFTVPVPSELFSNQILALGLDLENLITVAVAIIIMLVVGIIQEKGYSVREILEERPAFLQTLAVLVILIILTFFGIYSTGYISSEFIYGHV